MRQRTEIIRIAEVNELVVDELRVPDNALAIRDRRLHAALGILGSKPLLALIRLLLVESEVHHLVRLFVPLLLDIREVLKPLTSLCRCARTQTLILLALVLGRHLCTHRLLPVLQLTFALERDDLATPCELNEWSHKSADEVELHQLGPLRVKEIH